LWCLQCVSLAFIFVFVFSSFSSISPYDVIGKLSWMLANIFASFGDISLKVGRIGDGGCGGGGCGGGGSGVSRRVTRDCACCMEYVGG
jgi:hypothetical protein